VELPSERKQLLLHARVAQQGILPDNAGMVAETCLPRIVPFRGRAVHSLVAMVDWDHRLPSKAFTLRMHLFYDEDARSRFDQALGRRQGEIAERDLYPEFDVPDFAGLPADECYDVDLGSSLEIEAIRLTSPWRREVPDEEGARAVAAVRESQHFAEAKKATPNRGPHLGDLEAVAWTPPCESGHGGWTLDVWWLTAFDGRVGRGWSFLVDVAPVAATTVLSAREFQIRAG